MKNALTPVMASAVSTASLGGAAPIAVSAAASAGIPAPPMLVPVSSIKGFPVLPGAGERALLYQPLPSGDCEVTEMQGIHEPDKAAEVTDSQGKSWHLYYTLNSEYSLMVAAPDGSAPLRLDLNGSSRGYMKNVILAPDQKRLFILYQENRKQGEQVSTVIAYNLERGQQQACLESSGFPLENINVGENGTLYACGEGRVHVLDPDLRELRFLPIEGFIPSEARELPGGSLLLSGHSFRENGKVYGSYGTRQCVLSPDGTQKLSLMESQSNPYLSGESLTFIDSRENEAVRYDLKSGVGERWKAPVGALQVLRRDDGCSVWLMGSQADQVTVTTPSGRVIDSIELKNGRASHMTSSDDGRRLFITGESHPDQVLFSVDTSARDTMLGKIKGALFDGEPTPRELDPVYRTKEHCIAVPLDDGRIAVARPSGIDLLAPDGTLLATYADSAAARAAIGGTKATGKPLTGWKYKEGEDLLKSAEAQVKNRSYQSAAEIIHSKGTIPAGRLPRAKFPGDRRAEIEESFWGGSLNILPLMGESSATFPGGQGVSASTTMIRVTSGTRELCQLKGDQTRQFTAAVPFEVKGKPCLAVATTDGKLLVFRADYEYGPKVARHYPLPDCCQQVTLEGNRIIARGKQGDLLEVILSDEAEAVKSIDGGSKGRAGTGVEDIGKGASQAEGVYVEDEYLVVDDMRMPINKAPSLKFLAL